MLFDPITIWGALSCILFYMSFRLLGSFKDSPRSCNLDWVFPLGSKKKKKKKKRFIFKEEVFFPWVGVFRPFLQTVSASSAPLGVIIFPGSGEKGFSSPYFLTNLSFPFPFIGNLEKFLVSLGFLLYQS